MFKHILIPVDFSAQSQDALAVAQTLASIQSAQITVLHVIELIAETEPDGELDSFYADLEAKAKEKFKSLLQDQSGNSTFVPEVTYGDRVQEILSFAGEHGVDLIIMSSRRVDPQNPGERLGTISQKIGILAQCPVLLVK